MKPTSLSLLAAALGLVLAAGMADAAPRDHAAVHGKPAAQGAFHRSVDRKKDNGTRTVDVQGTTRDGRTWTRHDVTTRTEYGYTRHVEGTAPNGNPYSRDASVVRDKEAGTWTRTVDGVTPNGKTYSVDAVRQRTENGYTGERTKVTPSGTTIHDKVVATRNEDGSWNKDVTREVTPPQNDSQASE